MAKKIKNISVKKKEIKKAEEILGIEFGIIIKNKREKNDQIIGEMDAFNGSINQAKKAGHIDEGGNFILNPVKMPDPKKRFFCV